MAKYVLIESRDPFESNDVAFCRDLASQLKREGEDVTVFLVQNGVLPARAGAASAQLTELTKTGIDVLADAFSLSERGITTDRLAAGIKPAPLDFVIDAMAGGSRVLWH
jgi:sulfur relay (sulfurtransferase) complex TusBCD TusD component (DsrE family)